MLIAIKGCEAHFDRWVAQKNTWAGYKRPLDVRFYESWNLGVPDDYEHLPDKVKAICLHTLPMFTHVFLCDTDTYVHVPRLLASGYELHDYVGHDLPGGYASGGAGYWLSHEAQKIVAQADVSGFTAEDEMVGTVLSRAGITLHHDPRYTLALEKWPEPGNDLITKHLSMNGPYNVEMMYDAHRRANP